MKKSIYWIHAAIRPLVLTMVFCGTSVITSCSNDESSAKLDVSASVEQSKTFENTLNEVQDNMGKINFQELAPLASYLDQGSACVGCDELDSLVHAQFCETLKSLLESLCGCGGNSEPAQTWQLGDLIKTLQSAINVSRILEQLADNNFFGNNAYNRSFDIVLSDSLTYTVALEKKRATGATLTSATGSIMRKLTISKNGSTLLTIDSSQDNSEAIVENKLGVTSIKTGSLSYGKAKFTYERQFDGINSTVTTLSYLLDNVPFARIKTKGDNNLNWENFMKRTVVFTGSLELSLINGFVGLVSNVSDLNKFYGLGLALGGFSVAGTTKDNCQKHTDMFNSVTNTYITMFGQNSGTITYEPVLSDSVRNTYKPALMLQTSPEGEKVAIKDALESLGITLDNLMQMLVKE